jgi:hypothetical protein
VAVGSRSVMGSYSYLMLPSNFEHLSVTSGGNGQEKMFLEGPVPQGSCPPPTLQRSQCFMAR